MLTASFRPPSGGWYVRPPRPLQHRGRSRHVSAAAKARVASEERRVRLRDQHPIPDFGSFVPSAVHPERPDPSSSSMSTDSSSSTTPTPSSSPALLDSFPPVVDDSSDSSASVSVSSDSYDSPPTPPSSLEDQVHVAYAMDDIRLAKTLLLKLKGIEITSETDPRIDQVRDEDFDVYFVPSGPLTLEYEDRRAMEETQKRQKEQWAESQRSKRLKACEKLWEDDKYRLQAERLAAVRRREEEEKATVGVEQRRAAQKQHREGHQRCSKVAADKCSLESKREGEPFQYNFMLPTKALTPAPARQFLWSSKILAKQIAAQSSGSPRSSVSFKEVVDSMNGSLFPLDVLEQVEDARRVAGLDSMAHTRHRRKVSARAELLDNLLQAVEWHGEKRVAQGRDVTQKRPAHLSLSALCESAPISSVQSSDSLTSMSSPLSSRSNSWFSFGSWRSSYTDVTVPDAQVSPSPKCSAPIYLVPVHEAHWDHLTPRCSSVCISLDDSPLSPFRPLDSTLDGHRNTSPSGEQAAYSRRSLLQRVGRSVSGMVEVARSLQTVYISAAVMTAGSSQPVCTASHPSRPHARRPALPEGYRVHMRDVKRFTASDGPSAPLVAEPIHFIPLANLALRPPSIAGLPPHRLTTADKPIIPSPLRPRIPPTVLAYRMRPVANPALLRLRALQNIMCARGKEWEGRAREGGLGCGKERVVGIAFEGRGRSGLGCEVRFAIA